MQYEFEIQSGNLCHTYKHIFKMIFLHLVISEKPVSFKFLLIYSSYNCFDDMIDFFHLHKDGFNVFFSLNIQRLNAKLDKLHILQRMLHEKDIELDAF